MIGGSIAILKAAEAMVDVHDDDLMLGLVDAVPHPVLAAAGASEPLERCAQRRADNTWFVHERTSDELPRCEGSRARAQRKAAIPVNA